MTETNCDQHVAELAKFIKGKLPAKNLRDACSTLEARDKTANTLITELRGDPEFRTRVKRLTRNEQAWPSAIREALKQLNHNMQPVEAKGRFAPALATSTLVGAR